MGVSLIDIIKEEIRESTTGDDKFYVKAPYCFILNGPPLKGPLSWGGQAAFPLPVNPTDITYSLPFAVELTPLQQGGVSSEEGGICIGEISIDASMGFKPRKDYSSGTLGASDGEFTGLMGASGLMNQELSGQMHFWRLANRCFDGYSALKKDPESAHKTSLEFHSIRDQLHLTVVPREFSLHRNAGKERVSYRMSCRLAVVGPAAKVIWFSPDKDWISKIKDTISQIRAGVQAVAATIDDITAALDEIRRVISSVVSILDDITTAMNSFSSLIDGTKKFLDIPRQALVSLTENCEAVANLAADIAGWPADAVQAWRDLSDQMDALTVAGTTYFQEGWNRQVERYRTLVKGSPVEVGSRSFSVQSTPGLGDTTYSVADVFGGGEKPGDARRAVNVVDDGRLVAQEYQGFSERVVGHGDTLQSLAAKHLGDARKWLDLAIVNDLRGPFLTDRANIPNTLRVGDKIVIPVRAPQASPDVITTGNPEVGSSQAEANLGVDYYLVDLQNGTWGWEIDEASGSVDARRVRGILNFSQAIGARFRTEQGSNILYPAIGLPRTVGIKGVADAFISIRYQARQQLLADKRAERLGRFSLSLVNDEVQLDADIQPVGFSSLRTISRTLT